MEIVILLVSLLPIIYHLFDHLLEDNTSNNAGDISLADKAYKTRSQNRHIAILTKKN